MKIALCKSHFAGPVSGADETLVTYALALREAGHDVRSSSCTSMRITISITHV